MPLGIHCSSDDAFGTPYRIGCFVGSFWSEVRVTTRANKSIVMDLVREYDQKQQDQKQPNDPNKSTQTIHGGEPDCCSQTMKVLLTAVVFPALTSLSGKSVASRYTWESMAVWLVHLFYLTNSYVNRTINTRGRSNQTHLSKLICEGECHYCSMRILITSLVFQFWRVSCLE